MAINATPLIPQRSVLGMAAEATKGTAALVSAPMAGTLVYNANIQPINVFPTQRQPDSPSSGSLKRVKNVQAARLTFQTEVLVGDETGTLLSLCGFVATTGAYLPDTDRSKHSTGTFVKWTDGIKETMRGCSGTVTFRTDNQDETLIADWEFIGLYDGSADEAVPSPASHTDKTGYQSKGMTLTVAAGQIPAVAGITVALNTATQLREDATVDGGVAYAIATPGTPIISLEPELTTVANYDAIGKFLGGGQEALAAKLTNPATANTFDFDAPAIQRINSSPGARGDVATRPVELECQVSDLTTGGNDQLTITPDA